MSFVLGISDTHNASAAAIDSDGTLRALQEERPRGIKNISGLPELSIRWLLQAAGKEAPDVNIVALAGIHNPPERTRQETIAAYRTSTSWQEQVKRVLRHTPVFTAKKWAVRRNRIDRLERCGFARSRIRFYDHHLCHAAAAYFGWGKLDEPVLILTCDGAGDWICATVSVGNRGNIERRFSVDWSHSVARLYATVTYMMGMVPLEHEYKMMGMAPYAKTERVEPLARKLQALYEWEDGGVPAWHRRPGVPHMFYIQRRLEHLFFEERFDSIMGATQLLTERMMAEFARRAVRSTGITKVALSGGIFMNVKANKEILELPEVEELFVMPSAGDESNAIGASYLAARQLNGVEQIRQLGPLYLGPEWDYADLLAAIRPTQADGLVVSEQPEDLNQKVAELLASGEVVARFCGRQEFGARALGNRSILADPRGRRVVPVINEMIKNRDFWMPFAATVMEEHSSKYLVNPKRAPAPYMILSFDTTQRGSEALPAAIHPYDQTCRPQILRRGDNPDYWDLIEKFRRLTGVGGLLNTSLNLHGEPLAHSPSDAIRILLSSGLKYLVLGPFLLSKRQASEADAEAAMAYTVGEQRAGR